MPLTNSEKSALRTDLACVRRVDECETESVSFGSIPDRCDHQTKEPTIQLPTCSFADVLFLGLGFEFQVLENQYRVFRNPFTEFCSGFPTERPVSITLLLGQPFQRATHRSSVAVLCLLPSKFGLQTRTTFTSLGVANGKRFSTDEKCFFFSAGDQGIVDAEVDADRCNAFRFSNLQSDTEKSLTLCDTKAVDLFGSFKVLVEMFWNLPADLLSALKRGDRQATVTTKREIFGEEKKRCWMTKNKWTLCRSAVGLGGSVGGCRRSDGAATHLRSQGGWGLMIDQFLQIEGSKRLTVVKPDWAYRVLISVELRNGVINKAVVVKDYWDCSLNVHAGNIVTRKKKVKSCLKIKKSQFLPCLKAWASLREKS